MTEDSGYGLVMPFVICKSNGGPLDDHAFVAGVQFGDLYRRLETDTAQSMYVVPDIVPQLDLAAMHFGYHMTTEPWDEHNTLVHFTRGQGSRL
jgi:hypothetical protein